MTSLNYRLARAVEQTLLQSYGLNEPMLNKIYSIALSRLPLYKEFLAPEAVQLLSKYGHL